jgi:hypothetical protein
MGRTVDIFRRWCQSAEGAAIAHLAGLAGTLGTLVMAALASSWVPSLLCMQAARLLRFVKLLRTLKMLRLVRSRRDPTPIARLEKLLGGSSRWAGTCELPRAPCMHITLQCQLATSWLPQLAHSILLG